MPILAAAVILISASVSGSGSTSPGRVAPRHSSTTSIPAADELQLSVSVADQVPEHHVCVIAVETNAAHCRVRVRRSLFESVPVFELRQPGRYGWTSRPGVYLVEVDVFDAELGIGGEILKVTIGDGPAPPDPDDPDEPDVPDPDEPDTPDEDPDRPESGKWGVTDIAFDETLKLGAAGRDCAGDLSANYESTSAAIAAGGILTVDAAFDDIRSRNKATLAEHSESASDAVGQVLAKLEQRITQLWMEGELSNRDDVREIFEEIAAGFQPFE